MFVFRFALRLALALLALTTAAQTAFAAHEMSAPIEDMTRMKDGAACSAVVTDLANRYLDVVDASEKVDSLRHGDKLKLKDYQVLSPGSYDVDFRAEFELLRRGKPLKRLVYDLHGDYDCDGLRVRTFRTLDAKGAESLGGVERTD